MRHDPGPPDTAVDDVVAVWDMVAQAREAATAFGAQVSGDSRRLALVGCGDSFAAALIAQAGGHVAHSSGDIAWTGIAPRGCEAVVLLSWSGATTATVLAAQVSIEAGLPVIGVTSNADSPLAKLSDTHVTLPARPGPEAVPLFGFVQHAVAVAALTEVGGWSDDGTGTDVGIDTVRAEIVRATETIVRALPVAPCSLSVAATADLLPAAEFWMLKLIEATGLAVRSVRLEEVGHVDYFVGPQPHLTVILRGRDPHSRVAQLAEALERTGQTVVTIDTADGLPDATTWAASGSALAAGLAAHWGRPLFRGGAVDMSAAHIQMPTGRS